MVHRAILWASLATSVLACSSSESTTEAPLTIAYITHNKCNRFHDLGRAGAAQAQSELSTTSTRPVNVMILDPECPELTEDGKPLDPDDACYLSRPQMAVHKISNRITKGFNQE